VITFVDIDRVKQAEEQAQLARLYAENIVEAVGVPLLVVDEELRVVSANRAFYEEFRTTPKLVVGEPLQQLAAGQWDIPGLAERLRAVAQGEREAMRAVPIEATLPRRGMVKVNVTARRMGSMGEQPLILVAMEPSPERKRQAGE
jgi:two-component system CheB/CheR fusion protein